MKKETKYTYVGQRDFWSHGDDARHEDLAIYDEHEEDVPVEEDDFGRRDAAESELVRIGKPVLHYIVDALDSRYGSYPVEWFWYGAPMLRVFRKIGDTAASEDLVRPFEHRMELLGKLKLEPYICDKSKRLEEVYYTKQMETIATAWTSVPARGAAEPLGRALYARTGNGEDVDCTMPVMEALCALAVSDLANKGLRRSCVEMLVNKASQHYCLITKEDLETPLWLKNPIEQTCEVKYEMCLLSGSIWPLGNHMYIMYKTAANEQNKTVASEKIRQMLSEVLGYSKALFWLWNYVPPSKTGALKPTS